MVALVARETMRLLGGELVAGGFDLVDGGFQQHVQRSSSDVKIGEHDRM